MPEPKAKTINGLVFQISQPYEAGHSITDIEARVLNQVRAENVGNNVRAKLKEMAEANEGEAAMNALVAEKDAKYVFTAGNIGEGKKLDPYEREADKIARELLRSKLAETGRKLTVAPEGTTEDEWKAKIDAEVERIATNDEVVKAARQRVDAKRKQADKLLEAVEGVGI